MRHARLLLVLSFVTAGLATSHAQNKTIAPTENLVVDGVPAIPASLADDVRRYTESRPANFADWHPTRREMLISTRFGNTAQIHQVKVPGGARTQLTFFNEPIGGASFEPGQGRYFVFGKDVGATSSRSSIAMTWPTAASRCSPTAAARRTAAPFGAPSAIGSPTARPAAMVPTAISTS